MADSKTKSSSNQDQSTTSSQPQPNLKQAKLIIYCLLAAIAILLFAASYLQTKLRLEQRRYLKLEDKYVRVRMMLGPKKMQDLIDQSYQLETNN